MTESDIDKGWTSVAEQFDVQATIHSNLGSALTDDVIQPLRSIQLTEAKTIRAASLKKKRLEDQVKKQEESYIWDAVDLEKQRRLSGGQGFCPPMQSSNHPCPFIVIVTTNSEQDSVEDTP
ncbi:hypothetical protein COOONC_13217 [Cooperia oncophora]